MAAAVEDVEVIELDDDDDEDVWEDYTKFTSVNAAATSSSSATTNDKGWKFQADEDDDLLDLDFDPVPVVPVPPPYSAPSTSSDVVTLFSDSDSGPPSPMNVSPPSRNGGDYRRQFSSSSQTSSSVYLSSAAAAAVTTNGTTAAKKPRFQVTRPPGHTVNKSKSKSKGKDPEAEAEKERIREEKRLEKERKKEEEARLKALKKSNMEIQKSSRPGEAVKFMIVQLDADLNAKFDCIGANLTASEIRFEPVNNPTIQNSVTFKRELLQQAMNDDLQIRIVSKITEEDQVFVLLDAETAVPMIHAQMNSTAVEDDDCPAISLTAWVESVKSVNARHKVTLFMYDLEKYYRKLKKSTQQEYRNRVLNVGNADPIPEPTRRKRKKELPEITPTEIQGCLTQMQLQTGINYRIVKDAKEFSSLLVQYTRSIADAPFKKQQQESQGFDWFALADATGSVKVETDGVGLKRLWWEQLQQFNLVGPDMATAITNRYPSPMKLIEAYKRCRNDDEGHSMLMNLNVTSGVGPLAKTRKLGVEASRKMYRFFTSTNGARYLSASLDSR